MSCSGRGHGLAVQHSKGAIPLVHLHNVDMKYRHYNSSNVRDKLMDVVVVVAALTKTSFSSLCLTKLLSLPLNAFSFLLSFFFTF